MMRALDFKYVMGNLKVKIGVEEFKKLIEKHGNEVLVLRGYDSKSKEYVYIASFNSVLIYCRSSSEIEDVHFHLDVGELGYLERTVFK